MLSIEYHVRLLLRKIVEILVNVEGGGDGDGGESYYIFYFV